MFRDRRDAPVVPFLKWAGGKRWFVSHALTLVPPTYERYVEPFLGSAAMFFALRPKKALLSDLNARLIETYSSIQSDWQKVMNALEKHQSNHDKKYYYAERDRIHRNPFSRAAQFIYLNRTCWNGLYRVNLAGEFNVPKGTKSSVILSTDNFESVAELLKTAELRCSDFSDVLRECGRGDLVFIDPPYTVKHNSNGFVKYNEKLFSWHDQVRLRDEVVGAISRGARVIVTNADHSTVRALYRGVGEIKSIERASVLAANARFRISTKELVIVS